MMFALLFWLSILAIPARACEGECIVAITQAFVGNYSVSVQGVFAEAAANVARVILPTHSTATASKLIEPLLDAYERGAYDVMEKGIFPSYFHGKCQVNGVDPAGCPNPDCPVVCGTPGSMVHFYSVLQEIAFNVTSTGLIDVCASSSKTYQTLENAVLHELRTESPRRRSLRSAHAARHLAPHIFARPFVSSETMQTGGLQKRREVTEAQAKAHLRSVCRGMVVSLEKGCGGKAKLPNCSWEQGMKAFILSFP